MAVALRSASNSGRASGQNLTATEPSGAAEGDILVAIWEQDAYAATLGLPSGWTEVQRGNDGSTFAWVVGVIARGASAPDLTFTTNTGSQYRECIIACISGGALDDMQIATGSGVNGAANPPSATASTASDLSVALVYFFNGYAGTPTPPSGYSLAANSYGTGGGGAVAYRSLSASGAEDPGAFANGTGTSNYVAVTYLAKDAATPGEQDSAYKLGRVVSGGARLT